MNYEKVSVTFGSALSARVIQLSSWSNYDAKWLIYDSHWHVTHKVLHFVDW